MKVAILGTLCLILCGQLGFAQAAQDAHTVSSQLDEVATSFTAGRAFMGTVLVSEGDSTLLNKGYGEATLEWGIPNTPDVKFRIGSITKQFTAALVLLEQQDGRLSVRDPVSKYVSDAPPAWAGVTVDDLLHQTSGIPDFIFDSRYQDWRMVAHSPEEEMSFFKERPLNFSPGSRFEYSNSNYIVLGIILQKVSGKPFGELLSERILKPLGMTNSGLDTDDAIVLKRASGYQPGPTALIPVRSSSMSVGWSAGCMYSTTADLARWEHALYSGKVLSSDALRQMTTAGKAGYADALFVNQRDGLTSFEHGGSIEGFNSYMLHLPARNITVIVLSNVSGAVPDKLAINLLNVTLGKPMVLAHFHTAQTFFKADLANFTGVYEVNSHLALNITASDDGLMVQATGQIPMLFLYEGLQNGHPQFFTKLMDAQIEFLPADKGPAEALILHLDGQPLRARRRL